MLEMLREKIRITFDVAGIRDWAQDAINAAWHESDGTPESWAENTEFMFYAFTQDLIDRGLDQWDLPDEIIDLVIDEVTTALVGEARRAGCPITNPTRIEKTEP